MEELLKKEIVSLKNQLSILNGHFDLILDNLPILFFYLDNNKIFELFQGKGITESLMLHDPTLLYSLINKIPIVLEQPIVHPDSFQEKIFIGRNGVFSLNYQITKNNEDQIDGLVGFLIDQSEAQKKTNTQKNDNPSSKKEELRYKIRQEVNQQYNLGLLESFKQCLEAQISIRLTKLLIIESRSKMT